jgi:hypothetical protein
VTNRFIFSIFKRIKGAGQESLDIDTESTFVQVDSRYHNPESKLLTFSKVEIYETFAVMNTDTLLLKLKKPNGDGGNMLIYTAQEPKL